MSRWVLVVEDEPALGEMICDNLENEGYETELLRDGSTAIERLQRGGVDLVVLDIMLPGADGFTVLKEMRGRGDATPVLILSARAADEDRIRGLELQADDYLTKPFNLKELQLRVAAQLRRRPPTQEGEDTLELGDNRIDFRSHRCRTWQDQEFKLTPSEVKLLRMLASRAGEVLSRKEIVHHVFGPHTPPTHRSLDNMVLNLRRHLERDSGQPQHIHTVRGVGLRLTLGAEQ